MLETGGNSYSKHTASSPERNARRRGKFNCSKPLLTLFIVLDCAILAAQAPQAMAHLGKGLELFGLQRYAESIEELQRAVTEDPKLVDARYHLAVAYFNERQFEKARKQFELLAPTGYHKRWVTYYQGRLDLLSGNPDAAIRRFESLQGSEPWGDELYYLGSAYLAEKRLQESIRYLGRQISFNHRDFRAHYLLGRAYMMNGQTKEARMQFQESEQLHQYYLQGKQQLADCRLQLQAGHKETAWNHCASGLQTDDIDKLTAVGMLFGQFKYYRHALRAFKKALVLDPSSIEINYDLGYTYYQLKEYPLACKYAAIAVERRPDFFEALEVYGFALQKWGKNNSALPVLNRAHALRPDDPAVSAVLSQ